MDFKAASTINNKMLRSAKKIQVCSNYSWKSISECYSILCLPWLPLLPWLPWLPWTITRIWCFKKM